MQGLEAMGFKEATPIQQQAIPVILEGNDLLGCAQTGTGKTAAFVLPVIHKIVRQSTTGINTLVIVPTRELAQQIDQQIEGLGYFVSVSSMAVFGGGDGISWEAQRKSLVQGADIVVATPGRLIAMLSMDKVDFSGIKHLVLDEADRMLDMGFFDDIMRIISHLPSERQTLMFSATMPPKIELLARKILNNPHKINLAPSKPAEGVKQQAYVVFDDQKGKLLLNLLQNLEYESVLIFASTKIKVKQIFEMLKSKKINVEAFHSDLEQSVRQDILRKFKNKLLKVIVATDVLSRGIDVDNISIVINYDAPGDPEDYVHRVGRTARASRTGRAITFIGKLEQRKFAGVERLIGYSVEKTELPGEIGKGPEYNPERRSQGRKPKWRRPGRKKDAIDQGSEYSGRKSSKGKDEKPHKRFTKRNRNRPDDEA
ncbi:MAG: DEAD/DEAH box helicase [Bacteroidetes bacterium]|nr:MAG: DEAD/DEAH box helicase [Bacteroidota bacterium]